MARQVTTITEGPAGSGKSLARCAAFLVDEFLPDEVGVHLSNFPIFGAAKDKDGNPDPSGETYIDRITAHVVAEWGGSAADYAARLRQIPPDVESTWRTDVEDGGSGPWEWLGDVDITGWHIAIDEGHTVCGVHHSTRHKKRWMEYLGELRHRGATIEFLTQDVGKLAVEVQREAGTLLSLINAAQRRDPVFQICLEDWYEIYAGFVSRKWASKTFEIEHRKAKRKWIRERLKTLPLTAKYFRLYDSYDAPKHGGKAAANPPRREFERRTRVGLLLWFVAKNFQPLALRFGTAGMIAWLVVGGGGEMIFRRYFGLLHLKSESLKAERDAKSERKREEILAGYRAAGGSEPDHWQPRGSQRNHFQARGSGPPAAGPGASVRGLIPGGVILDDGTAVMVGEQVREDDERSVLQEVDVDRGRYRLERWRRLRDGVESRSTNGPDSVRGYLPSGGTIAAEQGGDRETRDTDVPRGLDAAGESVHVPDAGDWPIDRLGPAPRQVHNYAAPGRRDVVGSAVSDRQTTRR